MKLVDNFKIGIRNYIDIESLTQTDDARNIKLSFLTNVFGIVTYSYYWDVEFGKDILEVMNVISKQENFDYIYEENNHKKFLIVANLLEKLNWVEWGSSIRGCWFSDYGQPDIHYGLDYYNMKEIKFDNEGNDIKDLLDYISSEEL